MSTSTSTVGPLLCAHCGRPMASFIQIGGMMYHAECAQSPYAASPQPAAQPEQAEPGGLTDDAIFRNNEIMAINAGLGLRMEVLGPLVRAVEREVLSTRKLSDEQRARIIEAVREYAKAEHRRNVFGPAVGAKDWYAEVERLLRGEA